VSTAKEKKRVLVIGLDSATPDLLMKWVREGKLPTFAELIDNGVFGKLKSTIPPVTCPAWLSFMTGKNPGKLGIFDFVERVPGTYDIRVVNFQSIPSKSLWDIIGEGGKKVGVFNVPTTFPPKKVNGFIVSGWPIPQGASFSYPSDLQSKLGMFMAGQEGPERTIMMATWRWFAGEDDYLKGLYRFTEREVEATKYLMNNYDWDFFMTVFTCMDPLQHFFWKHMDPDHPLHDSDEAQKYGDEILRFYQRVDEIIREMLDDVSDDTRVIIMSDHGAAPLQNLFNINDWLGREGFLVTRGKRGFLSLSSLFKALLKRAVNQVTNLAYMLGLLKVYYFVTDNSHYLRALAWRVRAQTGVIPTDLGSLEEMNVDWSRTKAYSFGSGNVGKIYINVKGKEPQGIVEPGQEYEELRNQLIKELRNLKDPRTSRKIDVTIFKKEEIYHGQYLKQAPDIVFFMNEFRTGIDPTFGHDGYFTFDLSSAHDNARHKMDGVLIMTGPEFRKGEEISQAEIIDLAPTILYMMSYPIPSDMDGKVLTSAFKASYLKSNPIRYEKVTEEPGTLGYRWSKEEEERIKERLKSLGYID